MNKPYLLIIICTVLFLSGGCNNNAEVTPSQEFYIKFKVNGVQKNYSHSFITPLVFHYDQNGPIFNATIMVLDEGSPGTSNFINIVARNEETFQAGKDYLMQDPILYNSVKLPRL